MAPFHVTNKGEVEQLLCMAGLKYHSQVARIFQAISGRSDNQRHRPTKPS